MPERTSATENLSRVARTIGDRYRKELEASKKNHRDLSRDDFLWHYLLQSFATMGGANGSKGLIENPNNYSKVAYEVLRSLASSKRIARIEQVLRTAQVRWPSRKAVFISTCLDHIEALGGLLAAKKALLGLVGRDEKIAFLDAFPGIGPKYARNIMMDVYHKDFRESIALDSRIKAISKVLGLRFATYGAEEQFFLKAAHNANLEGWELDRLIWGHLDEFLESLSSKATAQRIGG